MRAKHEIWRYFGTPFGFRCKEPGLWEAEYHGATWQIERRRGEPGAPAGWYVFGPGTEGFRAGISPEAAAEHVFVLAMKWDDALRSLDSDRPDAAPPIKEACRHCGRSIISRNGRWIDPEATGDDVTWSETCDAHDTFQAEHEPQ